MHRVRGRVQHYAWGDTEALPSLLGLPADGRPWAEYWLGTHPTAPSTVEDDVALAAVAGELPFLLKVLAASTPLSLQTHPSAAQAAAGFAAEEAAGLPRMAPRRLYPDPSPKPELLVALTPFDAVCGFAPPDVVEERLRTLGAHLLADACHRLGRHVFEQILRRAPEIRPAMDQALTACRQVPSHPIAAQIALLDERHPGDPAVLVTLLMHHVTLQPGEAIFLPAGNLHAYLRGMGVELMASSDNVLRCGLTSKFVDVDAVIDTVDTAPLANPILPAVVHDNGASYEPADAALRLRRYDLTGDALTHRAERPELVLCTAGDARLLRAGDAMYLAEGEAIALTGSATVWVAG